MDERNNHFDFDFTPIGQAIKKAGQVNPVHELVDYTPEEVEETVVEEAVEAATAE